MLHVRLSSIRHVAGVDWA